MNNFEFREELYFVEKKNPFVVRFPDWLGIPEYQVASCTAPSCERDIVEHRFMNDIPLRMLGALRWQPLQIKFYRFAGENIPQGLMDYVREEMPLDTARRFTIRIDMLDPTDVIEDTWVVENCFITRLAFDDFDYHDDGLSQFEMEVNYDRATLIPH